jgi:hypothetical protein
VEEVDRADRPHPLLEGAGLGGRVQRAVGLLAADHRLEVLCLVVDRAAEADFAVGVEDRLARAPVVDVDDAADLPLDEAVAGRVGVFLVRRPRRHQHDPDQRRHPQPAPAGHAAEGGDRQQGDDAEDAGAVPEQRQPAERGEERRRPEAPPQLVPERRQHQRRRGQQHRRRQQLRPDVEAVEDRQAADQDRPHRQRPGRPPYPGGEQQRPEADDPELLQDDAEDLVVQAAGVPAEGPLDQHVADLQRRPVAGEPFAGEDRRRSIVAVGVEPVGEELRDRAVGRQRAGEAVGRRPHRLVDAAVHEAEEEEEEGAEGPEGQRRRQGAEDLSPDPAAAEDPGDQQRRAEGEEVGERFAGDRLGVVGPEAEHRADPGGREPGGEQNRDLPHAAAGCEQRPGKQREAGEHEVDHQQEE